MSRHQSQGNKNDRNDAEAIAAAARQGNKQLPNMLYGLLAELQQHWQQVGERIAACDVTIAAHAKTELLGASATKLISSPIVVDEDAI